ncbi:MAG: hypothetical protein JWQ66_336 [Mucilaginibacter sp.]|nr:hypothetical protein [Mucilaginibacter sp.]
MIKWQGFLLIVLLFAGCKKAFTPPGALADINNYLVIDGIINTGNDSTFIKLSRTKKFSMPIVIDHETGAQVTVESDANASYSLHEITPGTYSGPPLTLENSHKYRLRIKTTHDEEYLSDFVVVKNSPPIDSIGFTAKPNGVQIYVNTHDATNNTKYYRWEYTEAWRFHSTYESFFDGQAPRTNSIYYCYAKDTSSYITLASTTQLSSDVVYQSPITAIAPSSEKIQIRYSIEVKQYALTIDAYNFWNNLHKNSETNGSIFDAQPSDNQTNYHCLTNPGKFVVGYLSAGSTATKRIFINRDQLLPAYNPGYAYACTIETLYYAQGYSILSDTLNYTALGGQYYSPFPPFNAPSSVTYTTRDCADCTSRGALKAPYFWK